MNNTVHYAIAPDNRYLSFLYSNKPRIGLDLGRDPRPGTKNRIFMTLDGLRTFHRAKMFDIVDVTTLT